MFYKHIIIASVILLSMNALSTDSYSKNHLAITQQCKKYLAPANPEDEESAYLYLKGIVSGNGENKTIILDYLINNSLKEGSIYNSKFYKITTLFPEKEMYKGYEDTLLDNISLKLDLLTVPKGIKLGYESYYPAALLLSQMHVPRHKVLDAISKLTPDLNNKGECETKLRLLTWVLYKVEYDDKEITRCILNLEIERNGDKSGNFKCAVKMLTESDELLPNPYL